MTLRTTKRVETLLSDKTINSESNDYRAYGRVFPDPTNPRPAPLFGQQYKFGKAEAQKLSKAIVGRYDAETQKKVLKEIHARSTSISVPKGTIALTSDAARELNNLARSLGMYNLTFLTGQPRPIHPVG